MSFPNGTTLFSTHMKLSLCLMVGASVLLTVGCSKPVTINKKAAYQTIDKYRDNIVTDNVFSIHTASVLVSAGIDSTDCVDQIGHCITQLNKSVIDKDERDIYAVFAELHLAKLKSIAANPLCQETISRPPIDPYYADAPIPPKQQAKQKVQLAQCRYAYRTHAISAIKNSYAYLFFDDLQTNPHANSDSKTQYVAKDLDIQTKDVYEAASDALIKHIYLNRSEENLVAKDAQKTRITYFVDTALFDTSQAILSTPGANELNLNSNKLDNNSSKKNDNNQVKLLNVVFDPLKSPNNEVRQQVDEVLKTLPTNAEQSPTYLNVAGTDTIHQIEAVTDFKTDDSPVSVDVYVPNEPEYLQNTSEHNHRISDLIADHDLNFSDLNTISRRDGLGISYVALFEDRLDTSVVGLLKTEGRNLNAPAPENRIRLTGNVLSSGLVLPKGHTVERVLNSHELDIEMYNPHHTEAIDILGKPYYLAANFSASYGMWLAENGLSNVSYFSLLSKQQSLVLPQLYMLEPYDPNKRVLIMIHGLASSPATWVKVTNDISNDATLRNNYQVWQIFYPTNVPILENRYQIQKLIETAYQKHDPEGKHPASHHSVLTGHSMGAVIGRLLVSNENLEAKISQLDSTAQERDLDRLINTEIKAQNIKNRLHLRQLKSVDEAVFISAPFRGTDFADRWFTRALRRIIQLPIGFVQTIQGNLASIATEGELTANPLGALYLQNGASQLSDQSSFMKLTADLNIADNVTYHSIIANQDSDLYQGLQRLKADIVPDTQHANLPNLMQVKATIDNSPDLSLDKDAFSTTPNPVAALAKGVEQTITPRLSDGIVPYSSSHLEGAASETIISGGHGIQETPEAILTLRKILHQHLDKYPINGQPVNHKADMQADTKSQE